MSWLVMLGRYEAWLVLAVWAVVFLALAATLMRSARLPDPSAPASQ